MNGVLAPIAARVEFKLKHANIPAYRAAKPGVSTRHAPATYGDIAYKIIPLNTRGIILRDRYLRSDFSLAAT